MIKVGLTDAEWLGKFSRIVIITYLPFYETTLCLDFILLSDQKMDMREREGEMCKSTSLSTRN